jgi:predicted RNA methylase
MIDREYVTPFTVLQAASLLSHKTRIRKFRQAIDKVVKPDHYVIDLGSGSGVLAILAARKGARVTAVDANRDSLKYAEQAAKLNGVAENIEFVHTHFSDLELKERADVVICEMLSSMMLIEQQIPASLHAKKHLLKPNGRLIPEELTVYITPVQNETLWNRFLVDELEFPRLPQTADKEQSLDLADLRKLATINFSSGYHEIEQIEDDIEFKITDDGRVHGILGMFEAKLCDEVIVTMDDGWRDLFIPLSSAVEVTKGDSLRVHLSFRPGEYDSLSIKIG